MIVDEFEFEVRGVKFGGPSIPVSAEMLKDALDINALLRNPPPPRPEPTEPEIDIDGDDYWMVLGDAEEGVIVEAVYPTREQAEAHWSTLKYRRDYRVVGNSWGS